MSRVLMSGALSEEMLRYMRLRLIDTGPSDRGDSGSAEVKRLLFDSGKLSEQGAGR